MEYQLYDLKELDEHTRQLIVRDEVDKMLEGHFCTICNGAFIGRREKDESYCSGTHPLSYAHDYCFEKEER